ncbi:MAG: carbamoyltransferase HypF [Planctomycetes bacterium GWF2_50_10]|nr:MAG: carbamoyltransferase HypF [Planctomycetes bacterium GWF2_50_10]
MLRRKKIIVTGRVQGVGFRPYAYRLADELGLSGFVLNDTLGVTIEVQGLDDRIETFIARLKSPTGPPMMQIIGLRDTPIPVVVGQDKFTIQSSYSAGHRLADVSADAATCPDCLAEMQNKLDFRYRYPFINCTNCGPRYSIIKSIPYDRPNTTMNAFAMCENCRRQYESVTDRRFHAQPVACSKCGPRIYMTDPVGRPTAVESDEVITRTIEALLDGQIGAVKGIGGYHLAAGAFDDDAVGRLRHRKQREHKPFAMMAASIQEIEKHAIVSPAAASLLQSIASPIVLLPKRKDSLIAQAVAPGTDSFGFMLPYAPLHHLLFAAESQGRRLDVLVMTSANISDEPLIAGDIKAVRELGPICDFFLAHDREIHRQVDDSILHIVDGQPAMIRRSRGYVPTPIEIPDPSEVDILATGADLKNTFCLVKANKLILSEHIGDLENAAVYRHYSRSVKHLSGLFEAKPAVVACDLHPGYVSTDFARLQHASEIIEVQHHWAHAASVMAEYGIAGPVIALIADGTGYGPDGAIWGCECLVASLDNFQRLGHLKYYNLAGADKASKDASRSLAGLIQTFGSSLTESQKQMLLARAQPDQKKRDDITAQLDKNINTVQTSSLGRVFDAVAAIAGLGSYNHFEAQLPMALEAIADDATDASYTWRFDQDDQLDLSGMFGEIAADMKFAVPAPIISAKFHNMLALAFCAWADNIRTRTSIVTVALSGGVFCNRLLADKVCKLLKNKNFCVLLNRHVPAGDGGIALGQAAIAARKYGKKA